MQPGDEPPEPFSLLTARIENPQVACAITRTTEVMPQRSQARVRLPRSA